MNKRTTIYINKPIEVALKGATSISGRLGVICDRYAEITRRARIRQRFSEDELSAIIECADLRFSQAQLIDGAILACFEDAIQDGLCEKWKIDAEDTVEKLRALTFPDQVALVEEIEAHWRGVK